MRQNFARAPGADAPGTAFDPALYPRTYRIAARLRYFYIGLAVVLLTMMTAVATPLVAVRLGLMSLSSAAQFRVTAADLAHAWYTVPLIVLALDAVAIMLILWAQMTRVELYPDAIATGAFRMKRLARSEITGRKAARYGYGASAVDVISLYRHDGTNFDIPNMVTRDAAFDAWFRAIPVVEPFSAPLSGETQEEARRRLKAIRSTSWVGLAAIVLFFVLLFASGAPGTFLNVASLLLPAYGLLVAATVPGVDRLPWPNAMAPPLFLYVLAGAQLYRASQNTELVEWSPWFIEASLIVGGVLLALVRAVPALRRPAVLVGLAPLAILYGFVCVFTLNGSFDFAMPRQEPVAVTGKEVGRGYKGQSIYTIRVGAWGPRPAGEAHAVPAVVWRQLRVGETICVLRHPGALGVEWFALAYCRPQ